MGKRSRSKTKVQQIKDISSFTKPSRLTIGTLGITIFLITFVLYTPTLKNDFVLWDDDKYVYENSHIRSLNLRSLYWMLTSFHEGNWHPLTWVSHSLDFALWELNPWGHHLTNIILHGFNTLLTFLLVIQLIIKEKEATRQLSSKILDAITMQVLIVAGVTALLFGLHPLHVESVAWVAERKDLLCAFFFILSLLSYLSFVSSVRKKNRWLWFTTSLMLFICALMSKPMALTLPLILLLLDIYPLKRMNLHSDKTLSVLWEKIPFFLASIISGIITLLAQHSGEALRSLEQLPLNIRFLNALRALVFYLEKIAIPFQLVPFYPFPNHLSWIDPPYLLSALLFLSITGFCIWMLKQKNYLFFIVWSYYVITLLPVVGIIQVGNQAAADRYTYLPSVSIFLLIGIGTWWVLGRAEVVKHKAVWGGIVLIFLAFFIFIGNLTIRQIRVWQNSESLWSYVISVFPENVPFAHYNLGLVYDNKGRIDDVIAEYKRALAINPNYAEAHTNLRAAYDKKGRIDEAIAEYKRALVINPNLAEAHTNLGLIYAQIGRLDEAIIEYKKAFSLKPNLGEANNNLAVAYYLKKDYPLAIAYCDKAIEFGFRVHPEFLKALTPYR